METMTEILAALAPHAILVGSASVSDRYGDIDLVVSAKGLKIAKRLFPAGESVFPGHWATDATTAPIEVFRTWYEPMYHRLYRRHRELTERTLYGVTLRAWPIPTREE